MKQNIEDEVDSKSQTAGRVEIGRQANIENSIIRGPASIIEDCRIKNSFIGPFTSIGSGTTIEDSSVEHSVILENSHIYQIERRGDSLIGKGVEPKKVDERFKGVRLFVGDDAKLEL